MELVLQRLEADVVTYSTAISACGSKHRQTQLAIVFTGTNFKRSIGLEINFVSFCCFASLRSQHAVAARFDFVLKVSTITTGVAA